MIPIPIPEDTRQKGIAQGWNCMVIGPPEGDDWMSETGIRPVEALVGVVEDSGPQFNMLIQIEPDDMPKLAANGGRFWLVLMTRRLVPFSLAVYEPGDNLGD